MKTGGQNTSWTNYDSPKPPPVPESEHYGHVGQAIEYNEAQDPNDRLSERCVWWLRQINNGWRPNRKNLSQGWDCNTEWLGVRAWEYFNYIRPALKSENL